MGPFQEAYKLLEVQRESDDLPEKDDISVGSCRLSYEFLATTTPWAMMWRLERELRQIVLSP